MLGILLGQANSDFAHMNGVSIMATYTLGQAAKRLGLSKPTVSSKIKKGIISAEKIQDGSYRIDGAELARFEASYTKPETGKRPGEAPTAKRDNSAELQIAKAELASARLRIEELTEDRDQLRKDLDKTRERLDHLQDQLAALAQASVARGQGAWWQKLLGKG